MLTIRTITVGFALLALSAALAQPGTLRLGFEEDLYLSHVSKGLEGLASYRQSSAVTTITPSDDGEPTESVQEEHRAYIVATGDMSSHSSFDVMPGMRMTSEHYLIGGQGFIVGGMGDELDCTEVPPTVIAISPLETHVSDATGHRTATLSEAGVTVNGVLSDLYTLGDAPENTRFQPGTLEGQVWVAREGGFIVRYRISGVEASGQTIVWTYELSDVNSLAGIVLPEICLAP